MVLHIGIENNLTNRQRLDFEGINLYQFFLCSQSFTDIDIAKLGFQWTYSRIYSLSRSFGRARDIGGKVIAFIRKSAESENSVGYLLYYRNSIVGRGNFFSWT